MKSSPSRTREHNVHSCLLMKHEGVWQNESIFSGKDYIFALFSFTVLALWQVNLTASPLHFLLLYWQKIFDILRDIWLHQKKTGEGGTKKEKKHATENCTRTHTTRETKPKWERAQPPNTSYMVYHECWAMQPVLLRVAWFRMQHSSVSNQVLFTLKKKRNLMCTKLNFIWSFWKNQSKTVAG